MITLGPQNSEKFTHRCVDLSFESNGTMEENYAI